MSFLNKSRLAFDTCAQLIDISTWRIKIDEYDKKSNPLFAQIVDLMAHDHVVNQGGAHPLAQDLTPEQEAAYDGIKKMLGPILKQCLRFISGVGITLFDADSLKHNEFDIAVFIQSDADVKQETLKRLGQFYIRTGLAQDSGHNIDPNHKGDVPDALLQYVDQNWDDVINQITTKLEKDIDTLTRFINDDGINTVLRTIKGHVLKSLSQLNAVHSEVTHRIQNPDTCGSYRRQFD